MIFAKRHPFFVTLTVIFLFCVLAVGGYAYNMAEDANMLPWQPDPTRIPVTPFADIPGFNAPAETPTASPTP